METELSRYPDIIAIGIPFMIACLVIEYFYDFRKKQRNYRWNNTVSNVSCGIFEQATGFLSKGLFLFLYFTLYENYRYFTIEDTWWVWIVLVVLVDLVFYFFHRLSHRSSFLWAGHMIHHEVDKFNLSVALRRSVMQEFTIISVYLPFALLGFSPAAFFLVFAGQNLYQFLIHTSYLPEFKWFGKVFNTPYHHEIHHGRNKAYIDKNFAGVFIIWDKIFGTFAEKTEAVEFGIGQQTRTLNPIIGQVDTLGRVIAETKRRKGLKAKLQAFFGSPRYLSVGHRSSDTDAENQVKQLTEYNPFVSKKSRVVTITLFAMLVVTISIYRNFEHSVPLEWQLLFLTLISIALYSVGLVLDNKLSQNSGQKIGTEIENEHSNADKDLNSQLNNSI